MGANRFMVLKFRDIIKTALFAVIGAAIIAGVLYFILSGGSENNQVYNPGTYSSDIVLDNGKVTVEVTVSKTKIKSVELKESTEEIPGFYPPFESAADNIGNYVVKEQELSYVPDEYSSVTSGLVLDAVERSLEQAKVNRNENRKAVFAAFRFFTLNF